MRGYDLCKKEFASSFDRIARMGYGLLFISHSAEKKMKDEKGEDYISLAPALPQRPYDIVNKMVDIIGYIRVKKDLQSGLTTHKIYFRGDDNFLAGSRYKYIVPEIEFEYPAVEKAILDAIDKQVAESGGTSTTKTNEFFAEKKELDYNALMGEARDLWGKIVGNDTNKAQQVRAITKEIFGKETQISKVESNQVELLNALVERLRDFN